MFCCRNCSVGSRKVRNVNRNEEYLGSLIIIIYANFSDMTTQYLLTFKKDIRQADNLARILLIGEYAPRAYFCVQKITTTGITLWQWHAILSEESFK